MRQALSLGSDAKRGFRKSARWFFEMERLPFADAALAALALAWGAALVRLRQGPKIGARFEGRGCRVGSVRLGDITTAHGVEGSGPPVVLIHGLGSSLRDWEAEVPALRLSYRVLTYDVRGHGNTSKPRGPSCGQ